MENLIGGGDNIPAGFASSSAPFVPGAIYFNPNLDCRVFSVDVGDMSVEQAHQYLSAAIEEHVMHIHV